MVVQRAVAVVVPNIELHELYLVIAHVVLNGIFEHTEIRFRGDT